MHELSLARSIGEIAVATLREQPQRESLRVGRIRVKVGELSGVEPDALTFCFEVVRGEWVEAEGAALDIERCPARVICSRCGVEEDFTIDVPHCRVCGGPYRGVTGGRELEVFGVELVTVG